MWTPLIVIDPPGFDPGVRIGDQWELVAGKISRYVNKQAYLEGRFTRE